MTPLWSGALTVVLFVTSAGSVAAQEDASPSTIPEIRTSASSSLTVPPDLATISITFTARGRSPRAAGLAAAERANAIRRALIAVGIPKDSLPTGRQWGWWGNRSSIRTDYAGRDTTYVTTEALTARIRDLTLIGPAIDTALSEGAQEISNVQFTATETGAAYVQALKDATRLVRQRAEAMAQAAGGTLGRTIELTTEPRRYYEESTFMLRGGSIDGGSATSVVAPQITVTVTVYGRWEFRPNR